MRRKIPLAVSVLLSAVLSALPQVKDPNEVTLLRRDVELLVKDYTHVLDRIDLRLGYLEEKVAALEEENRLLREELCALQSAFAGGSWDVAQPEIVSSMPESAPAGETQVRNLLSEIRRVGENLLARLGELLEESAVAQPQYGDTQEEPYEVEPFTGEAEAVEAIPPEGESEQTEQATFSEDADKAEHESLPGEEPAVEYPDPELMEDQYTEERTPQEDTQVYEEPGDSEATWTDEPAQDSEDFSSDTSEPWYEEELDDSYYEGEWTGEDQSQEYNPDIEPYPPEGGESESYEPPAWDDSEYDPAWDDSEYDLEGSEPDSTVDEPPACEEYPPLEGSSSGTVQPPSEGPESPTQPPKTPECPAGLLTTPPLALPLNH